MQTTFDKHSEHFNALKFVAKAVAKFKGQDQRDHLNNIYCDGLRIMATNGHRLHVYEQPEPETPPLDPGYYEILKNTKTELRLLPVQIDQEYPDIMRIMPSNEGLEGFDAKSSLFGKFAQVIRSLNEGSINTDYFKAALEGTDICMFKATDGASPILLKGGFLTAVIMPIGS